MMMQQLEHEHGPNHSTVEVVRIVKRLEDVVGRIREKKEVRISNLKCEASDHRRVVLVGINSCFDTGTSRGNNISTNKGKKYMN